MEFPTEWAFSIPTQQDYAGAAQFTPEEAGPTLANLV